MHTAASWRSTSCGRCSILRLLRFENLLRLNAECAPPAPWFAAPWSSEGETGETGCGTEPGVGNLTTGFPKLKLDLMNNDVIFWLVM